MNKAQDIKQKLDDLINLTSDTEPKMYQRLNELKSWIKDKKNGLLNSKKQLLEFLDWVITDVEYLLVLNSLNPAEKDLVLAEFTPTEQYWYNHLFPLWFEQSDVKFSTWKQKLMTGENQAEDAKILKEVSLKIQQKGGTIVQRIILDFSMATDLLISGNKQEPLAVQITTLAKQDYLKDKVKNWQDTLDYWQVLRAIFVSYHPTNSGGTDHLAHVIFKQSDSLPLQCRKQIGI
jgi:hypothetical protein